LPDDEVAAIYRCAEHDGRSASDFMRDDVLERVEDAKNLAALREALAQDDGTRYSSEQALQELGMH
jgi:RHH-type rel operon transcriptional repressor/antitoxin RelB